MVKANYLLDTNMWIYALKGNSQALTERLAQTDPTTIAFCSIVKAELFHGAQRYGNRERRIALLRSLFDQHQSFTFCDRAAEVYGQIRYELESSGQTIGPMDMLIAAIAIVNNLTLVTYNIREFMRIEALEWEDWAV